MLRVPFNHSLAAVLSVVLAVISIHSISKFRVHCQTLESFLFVSQGVIEGAVEQIFFLNDITGKVIWDRESLPAIVDDRDFLIVPEMIDSKSPLGSYPDFD